MTKAIPDEQLFLGRQPILDADQRLVAYELLFRAGRHNSAQVTDGVHATATVIANAFAELSIGDALGDCHGFINVDEAFLFSDILELLPRHSVVLEILETVPPSPAVIERCRDLKAAGFTLALDDVTQVAPAYAEMLDLVEIIKVDIQPLDSPQLHALTHTLLPLRKLLLAEKVDSHERMEECKALGYSLFQGYYFAKPTVISGRKLSHDQLSLMKLIGLLFSDADTAELEAVLKRDPGLSVNLLRMTNSVGSGTIQHITSLRHAITVLGRRQLQRWLQLLLFAAASPHGTASPLLQLAATRGRLLELLAARLQPNDRRFADQAFMTGIMSLLPALTNQSIHEIAGYLGLEPAVRAALCAGSGSLGALVQIAELVESDDYAELANLLSGFPQLPPAALNCSISQAMAWAGSIAREPVR